MSTTACFVPMPQMPDKFENDTVPQRAGGRTLSFLEG